MQESYTQNYEALIRKHQKFKEIIEIATLVEIDFNTIDGESLREKSITLTSVLSQFQIDYVIAGPETLALLEIGNCATKTEKDILFPMNELLLVSPNPMLIKIKNFSV